MATTVRITVEDVAERLADGYTEIELVSATSPDGSYSAVDTEVLVEDTFYYSISDASGTPATWYKYRFTGDSGAAPLTDYSNPFQVDTFTRQALRQFLLEEYRLGLSNLPIVAGGNVSTAKFEDYRIATSLYATGRGFGTWLDPVNGALQGQTRRVVTGSSPSAGTFVVNPVWGTTPATGSLMDWLWMADPETLNLAIRKALSRYKVIDRVPLSGLTLTNGALDLSFLPWLQTEDQVAGLWWQPTGAFTEQPWGSRGRWWQPTKRDAGLYLLANTSFDSTAGVYLEAWRYLSPLHTDESVLDPAADLEAMTALAYDELLGILSMPMLGAAASDNTVYRIARRDHQPTLRRLATRYSPRVREQMPQLSEPPNVPRLFRGR